MDCVLSYPVFKVWRREADKKTNHGTFLLRELPHLRRIFVPEDTAINQTEVARKKPGAPRNSKAGAVDFVS